MSELKKRKDDDKADKGEGSGEKRGVDSVGETVKELSTGTKVEGTTSITTSADKTKAPSHDTSLRKYEILLVVLVALLAASVSYLVLLVQDAYDGDYGLFVRELKRATLGGNLVRPTPTVRSGTAGTQGLKPEHPVVFTVHFNGDGQSKGIFVNSSSFSGLDELIEEMCFLLVEADELISVDRCAPSAGARLFSHSGVRLNSFLEVTPNTRTYIVPQGVHFVYPIGKVGDVIFPENVESPIPEHPIRLRQLSMSPRVFAVDNFMTMEEVAKVIEHNEHLVKPSEVGFSGWRDSTRTSQTAWDFSSWAAKRIQQRSFDLVGIPFDREMSDALQVLRYNITEWYKPHTDWFDAKGYDNHDPTVNNGTNRFATVFLYLSDVEEGGETVFPLSTTHEGYNGERLVHAGTEKTPGYIADSDAKWVCNTTSTALRSKPRAGHAVLFYSQGPRGELDRYSLHGACPVIKGLKWGANVWIWNRPKPSKSAAKDKDEAKRAGKKEEDGSLNLRFRNDFAEKINVYWDDGTEEMVFQMQIDSEELSPITTYEAHRFVARSVVDNKILGDYRVQVAHNGQEVPFVPVEK